MHTKPVSKTIKIREEGYGNFLLINPYGKIIKLNRAAKFIFDRCNGSNTLDNIAAALKKEFLLPISKAQKDTLFCIAMLYKASLLEFYKV